MGVLVMTQYADPGHLTDIDYAKPHRLAWPGANKADELHCPGDRLGQFRQRDHDHSVVHGLDNLGAASSARTRTAAACSLTNVSAEIMSQINACRNASIV